MLPNSKFYDHVAEQSVLEAIFLDQDKIYETRLKVDDFHLDEHKQVFIAMLRCYSDGLTFDFKTLTDNGASFPTISKIVQNMVTAANFFYHERIVLNKSFARKSQKKIIELTEALGEDTFLTQAETAIGELQEQQNIQPEKTVKDILNDIHTSIITARTKGFEGILTGFPKLNEYCVGMCPRHFWIIGGLTSQGKSTVLSQIIRDTCRNDAGVVVFSVEDSRQDKMNRLVSTISGVPILDIVHGRIEDWQYGKACHEMIDFNLHVYDDVYTIPEIDLKIKKHKLQGKVDIVAVDFIQNLLVKGEGIYDRMSEAAIQLQKLAKKYNICMVVLSQMTGDKMRGAQEIESAADTVLWINREDDNAEFDLIIKKNRQFGRRGRILMEFCNNWTGIREI